MSARLANEQAPRLSTWLLLWLCGDAGERMANEELVASQHSRRKPIAKTHEATTGAGLGLPR